MNILGNSLKYTSKGAIKISLDQPSSPARSRAGVRIVRITITDSGRGIGEDFLRNHLFAPFAQEDSLSAGAGLGLSLVKQITNAMGGSVQVQSKVDKGSTVIVRLPLEAAVSTLEQPARVLGGSRNQVDELRGLRVQLLGFTPEPSENDSHETAESLLDEYAALLNMCQGWLGMQVIEPSETEVLAPDVLLCNEHHLDRIMRGGRTGLSTPAIVICRNAVVAGTPCHIA